MNEFTLEKIFAPGKGGTPEVLNWFVPLGAVGARTKGNLLCYEPVPEWATGIGILSWDIENKQGQENNDFERKSSKETDAS